jgi:DNA-binding protein YbaB
VVTDPGLTLEQRMAEAAKLQGQADAAMATLQARVAGVREAQQEAMKATGEASSKDGVVRVVVDGTGVVTSLVFAPSAFDRSTPERLAQTTVATIQQAAAQARGRMSAALAPVRADEEDTVAAAARGAAALGVAPLPVPEVPRTAVDPTGQDNWTAIPGDQQQADWAGPGTEGSPWGAPVEDPPAVEPKPAPAASNRPRRSTQVEQDGSDDWLSDERPW